MHSRYRTSPTVRRGPLHYDRLYEAVVGHDPLPGVASCARSGPCAPRHHGRPHRRRTAAAGRRGTGHRTACTGLLHCRRDERHTPPSIRHPAWRWCAGTGPAPTRACCSTAGPTWTPAGRWTCAHDHDRGDKAMIIGTRGYLPPWLEAPPVARPRPAPDRGDPRSRRTRAANPRPPWRRGAVQRAGPVAEPEQFALDEVVGPNSGSPGCWPWPAQRPRTLDPTTRRNGRAAAGAVPESPSAPVRLRDSAHRADRVGRDSAPALAGRVGRHPVTDRRSRRR